MASKKKYAGGTPKKNVLVCKVCNVKEKKYKCPTCKILYCSKECYQGHKANGTCDKRKESIDEEKKKKQLEIGESDLLSNKRKRTHNSPDDSGEDEGYILPMENYNRLINTAQFKKYFLDKRFQKVVKEINSAKNRRQMLAENIKNDKYFSDIVDEMLIILGIANTDNNGNLTVE